MKRIIMIATTAVAALTMAGIIAAGTASAGTVLCGEALGTCPEANIEGAGASFNTVASTTRLEGERGLALRSENHLLSLTCEKESVGVTTFKKNGKPLPAEYAASIEPHSCAGALGLECTSVTSNHPKAAVESSGANAGAITIGSSSEPLTVSMNCAGSGLKAECEFAATGPVTMSIEGGKATIKPTPLVRTRGSGFFCESANTTIGLKNELPSGSGTALSRATETVLCVEEAAFCANENVLPSGTPVLFGSVHEGDSLSIIGLGGTELATCEDFGFGYETTTESGEPLPVEGVYASLPSSGCTFHMFGADECSSAALNKTDATLRGTSFGVGTIEVGSVAHPLTLALTCYDPSIAAPSVCDYSATGPIDLSVSRNLATNVVEVKASGASMVRIIGDPSYCRGATVPLHIQATYVTTGVKWGLPGSI